MSLLDDYQNRGAEEDEEGAVSDPEMARRNRLDLERQVVILNSDLKKIVREIEDLEMQKRKLKKDGERIRVDQDELDKKLKSMDSDRMSLEDQILVLKKKLKVLH